jgi:hypothetical protein
MCCDILHSIVDKRSYTYLSQHLFKKLHTYLRLINLLVSQYITYVFTPYINIISMDQKMIYYIQFKSLMVYIDIYNGTF